MAIYEGQQFVDSYDVELDDNLEKHMRWFVGAVTDEGGTRVRITQRDADDGRVKNVWTLSVDQFFEQSMDGLIEELVEERLLAGLQDETHNSW